MQKTAQLSASYRKGANSSGIDLAAYVVSRVPATYAANLKVHEVLARALLDFNPRSLLDIGTGPGTASWAALANWPSLETITQCEQDQSFAWLATKLNLENDLLALKTATLLQKPEASLPHE